MLPATYHPEPTPTPTVAPATPTTIVRYTDWRTQMLQQSFIESNRRHAELESQMRREIDELTRHLAHLETENAGLKAEAAHRVDSTPTPTIAPATPTTVSVPPTSTTAAPPPGTPYAERQTQMLHQSLIESNRRYAESRRQIDHLSRGMARLEADRTRLKADRTQLHADRTRLKEENARLKAEHVKMEAIRQDIQASITALATQQATYRANTDKELHSLQDTKRRVHALEAESRVFKDMVKTCVEEFKSILFQEGTTPPAPGQTLSGIDRFMLLSKLTRFEAVMTKA
ncbi:hypothetical protein HK104_005742 [Borealophlyctis nickersoniae]|nr:hypothetical protein HK104_005742 [Borealophlyctis nickersoniae]